MGRFSPGEIGGAKIPDDPRRAWPRDWRDWRWQLRNRLQTVDQLAGYADLTDQERCGLALARGRFTWGATPYYASLMDRGNATCPIRRQIIPSPREAEASPCELRDPLGEDERSPSACVVHKYPDRVLLLAVDRCAVYCRHCNRRRKVAGDAPPTDADLDRGLEYIAQNRRVRDVLISGGDPLTLSDRRLGELLSRLRAIEHVEIIRIGTRAPVALPMRITRELCALLRRFHPLYVNTHFNHPKEMTADARAACGSLVDAGIPVSNQAVLLRGINSSARCMRRLMRDLVKARVRPYYLFEGDTAEGTDHLRVPVGEAIAILQQMRGWISGMAIPHLVIDAPGGGGKIPIGADYLVALDDDRAVLRDYRGRTVTYPQPRETDCTVPYDRVYFADEPPDDDREGSPGR